MAGRQISFFMAQVDELEFVNYLHSQWDASFIKRLSTQREPTTVLAPFPRPANDPSVRTLLIRISGLECGWTPKTTTIDGLEHSAFSGPANGAIEFSRSWQNADGILVRGRLYLPLTEMKELMSASDWKRLEQASGSIWRWIRRRATKSEDHWSWVFAGAVEALAAGKVEAQR